MKSAFDQAVAELAFAYQKVPFFKEHLDGAGISPGEVRTEADWRKVPPTRKMHYRRHFPDGVLAAGRTLDEPRIQRLQSSGTEGERLITVFDATTLALRWFNTMQLHPRFAQLYKIKGLRTGRYAAPNCSDVECANPNATMADRTLADGTLVLPVYHDLLTTPESMLRRAASELVEYQPHLLYIDPTHLAHLVRFMRAAGIAPPPVPYIAASYTLCSQVARREIIGFFPAESAFAEVLAMSEFGWVGMECPKGSTHLNDRSYLLELLGDGRPAAPGELAELHVTSLGDRLLPHIRYRTGDLYRAVAEPCPCGSKLPRVRMEGRAANAIWRAGQVQLTPRAVDDAVGAPPGLQMYQLEQLAESELAFRFIATEAFDSAADAALKARLAQALGPGASLRWERSKYLPTERSGKFLTCKSALAEAAARKQG